VSDTALVAAVTTSSCGPPRLFISVADEGDDWQFAAGLALAGREGTAAAVICRYASSRSAPCSSIFIWPGCAAMLWRQAGFGAARPPIRSAKQPKPQVSRLTAIRVADRVTSQIPIYVTYHVSFDSGGTHPHETSVRSTAGEGEK
jgi:hypothetical protein